MIRVSLRAAFCLTLLAVSGEAQQQVQSLRGVVRSLAGIPLVGADVLVGQRQATTDGDGAFRIDSLRPGQYPITIRLVGYTPLRSRVAVVAAEPTLGEYVLMPAPLLLPAIVVEGRRTGVYGTVGDTGYRAAVGARVEVIGTQGGEVLTDSMGRFAFPNADRGAYLVRVTFAGYTERRLMLEVKRGEGRELAFLLSRSNAAPPRNEAGVLQDLGKRLAFGTRRERLSPEDLARNGSGGLCDMPQLRSEVGRRTTTLILNGTTVIPDFEVMGLCAWRSDEVELVEFGSDVCKESTQTIRNILEGPMRIWCSGRTRNVPRSLMSGGQRVRTQTAGGSYVLIWEKM